MEPEPNKRPRQRLAPRRLPEKLLAIRLAHGLTQAEMICIINEFETAKNRARVNQYETGKRTPSLVETNKYAVYAELPLETLFNDKIDLPSILLQPNSMKVPLRKKPDRKIMKRGKQITPKCAEDTPVGGSRQMKTEGNKPDADLHSTEPASGEPSQPKSEITAPSTTEKITLPAAIEKSADNFSLTEAYRRVFDAEIMKQCQTVYSELAAEVPFDKKWLLSTNKFLELLLAVALNDYRAHGKESAVAYRVRLLIEDQTDR